jgi:hypothetical protein
MSCEHTDVHFCSYHSTLLYIVSAPYDSVSSRIISSQALIPNPVGVADFAGMVTGLVMGVGKAVWSLGEMRRPSLLHHSKFLLHPLGPSLLTPLMLSLSQSQVNYFIREGRTLYP